MGHKLYDHSFRILKKLPNNFIFNVKIAKTELKLGCCPHFPNHLSMILCYRVIIKKNK